MILRSIRSQFCQALLARLLVCCQEFFPMDNDPDELQHIIDLRRRASDLAQAADAAAESGNWQVVPALETRRQEVDEKLREAIQSALAHLEAEEIRNTIGQPNLPHQARSRLFATQARLNFAFANLYMRLTAAHEG